MKRKRLEKWTTQAKGDLESLRHIRRIGRKSISCQPKDESISLASSRLTDQPIDLAAARAMLPLAEERAGLEGSLLDFVRGPRSTRRLISPVGLSMREKSVRQDSLRRLSRHPNA
jgi:hypothetical protein